MNKKFKTGLIYSFAIVSGLFALFVIYKTALDTFNPDSNSFQMSGLSESTSHLFDLVEILIYIALVVTLTI